MVSKKGELVNQILAFGLAKVIWDVMVTSVVPLGLTVLLPFITSSTTVSRKEEAHGQQQRKGPVPPSTIGGHTSYGTQTCKLPLKPILLLLLGIGWGMDGKNKELRLQMVAFGLVKVIWDVMVTSVPPLGVIVPLPFITSSTTVSRKEGPANKQPEAAPIGATGMPTYQDTQICGMPLVMTFVLLLNIGCTMVPVREEPVLRFPVQRVSLSCKNTLDHLLASKTTKRHTHSSL
eukprot:TRINITY_DN54600_c0_g1_i1.p2 TRINITY_DN54600_c0_g1~~TRINITY_DN54600_c0_g1_i1.p2  ORF type:complete len:233 (+),score=11.95 TRINITY_DN54600_c0_g1_i1:277-975(+)